MPLDNYEPQDINDHLPEPIRTLSEAETLRHLQGMRQAIDDAIAQKQLKEGLNTIVKLAKPFLPIPL